MLSKKPMKPAFTASSMLSRKPTGSRLMSSIACIALVMMLPSSSVGKFISRRISVTTTSMTTPTNSMSRDERLAEQLQDAHERADRIEQVVERQRVPDAEEDPGDHLERDAEPRHRALDPLAPRARSRRTRRAGRRSPRRPAAA